MACWRSGLSVSGLYGVLIYTLSQRTREIGIRVALGATAAAVVKLVMAQSARLAGIGAAIGVVLACGALGAIGSVVRLRSVTWLDPVAFATALALDRSCHGRRRLRTRVARRPRQPGRNAARRRLTPRERSEPPLPLRPSAASALQ